MIALLLSFRDALRPHRARLALGLVALVLSVAATVAEPWPLKLIVDSVLGTHPLPDWMPAWLREGSKDTQIAVLCLALLGIVVLGGMLTYVGTFWWQSIGMRLTFHIREAVHDHLHRLSLSYHHSQQPGDLANRLTADVDRILSVAISAVVTIVTSGLMLVGMLTVMLLASWKFTLLALASTPLLLLTVFRYTNRVKILSRRARKQEGRVAAVVQESLSAIHLVQGYTREEYEFERFRREAEGSLESSLQATNLQARFSPMVDVATAIAVVVVLWVGSHQVLSGALTLGLLLVFLSYLKAFYKPIKQLTKLSYEISRGSASAERLLEVMESAPSLPVRSDGYAPRRVRGAIEFEYVWFRYPTGKDSALRGVSFTASSGQVTALVGPTGAGKSTTVSLIPRFYDVMSGCVRVDGIDVRNWELRTLRSQVSLVLQETWLFQASILENIAYGREGASTGDVVQAAIAANAHDFIERLPDSYDTVVGPRGATLSGGQRQRISIARAILRDAPILILDEPTTGLDPASEELVLSALRRLMADRTSIVIAHGDAPVIAADQILVIRDGTVVERGSYEELRRQGRYLAPAPGNGAAGDSAQEVEQLSDVIRTPIASLGQAGQAGEA
jgi:ABC-type multidrug transport system fused ATPase/permease subunit